MTDNERDTDEKVVPWHLNLSSGEIERFQLVETRAGLQSSRRWFWAFVVSNAFWLCAWAYATISSNPQPW
jgi:hypothetical protein